MRLFHKPALSSRSQKSRYQLFDPKMIWLGILPGLLIFVVIRLIPSIMTFLFSFTDISQIPGNEIHFVGLKNYIEVFQANSRDTYAAFGRTMVFMVSVTVVQTAIALFIAVVLNSNYLKGKTLYRTIVFLPVILGVTVCGLSFKLFFSIDGPAKWFLGLFGKTSTFFGDWNLGLYLVIFCQIWFNVGSEMVIFLAGLQNVSHDLIEAARIDGANERQVLWKVTIPQIVSVVAINLIMCMVGSLSAYQIILITTRGSTNTTTLAMMIFRLAFSIGTSNDANAGRQGYAAALQMVLFMFILIFTILSQYLQNRVEEKEGVSGD